MRRSTILPASRFLRRPRACRRQRRSATSKFYGDISERLTAASTHLLFFALELNRVDDAVIEKAMQAPELGHYRPWIEDCARTTISARGSCRAIVSRKIPERLCRLDRLFDQRSPACASRSRPRSWRSSRRSACCRIATAQAQGAADALAKTFKANERTFALITTRSPRTRKFPTAGAALPMLRTPHLNNRVEREVVDALVSWCDQPIETFASLLRAEGGWFKKKKLPHWDRNAPLPFSATGSIAGPRRKAWC